jgi:hypothetical protein
VKRRINEPESEEDGQMRMNNRHQDLPEEKPWLDDLLPVAGAYAHSALVALEDERAAGRLRYYWHSENHVWMVVIPDNVVPGGDEVSVAIWCVKWYCDFRWEYLDRERREATGGAL